MDPVDQGLLFKQSGALVVDTGAPFCLFEMSGKPRGKGALRFRVIIPQEFKMRTRQELPDRWWEVIYAMGYTDAKTVAYMEALSWCARAAMKSRTPTNRPVALLLHAYMPIPVSWPKSKQFNAKVGALRPMGKPDWDNIGKMCDALTGVVWIDDAPVVDARVIKYYSERPALRVEVREFVEPRDTCDMQPKPKRARASGSTLATT